MAQDPRDKEAAFIATLAADTGRDLAAWMALIDSRSFAHRNDMIDWLRQQGLTFARASRLERIHHNGGMPVYPARPPGKPPAIAPPVATPAVTAPVMPDRAPAAAEPSPVPPAAAPQPPLAIVLPAATLTDTGDLSAFFARAKGYRPLAEYLVRAIRSAVPATIIIVHDSHADLAAPNLYGALAVTARDVRLALALGEETQESPWKRLRPPGMPPSITHTHALTDARKIDAGLLALVVKAAARANT